MSMKTLLKTALVSALAMGVSVSAMAENIAITGGTAFTKGGAGKVENATVLIKDGKIETVEAGLAAPAGYRVIDASGKWVTPGLMVSNSSLGLMEVALSGGMNDASVSKPKSAIALNAMDGFTADNVYIPITRIEGVTRAATGFGRTGSIWKGQGAVIHLGHGIVPVVKEKAFVALNLSESGAGSAGKSRAEMWAQLYAKLDE